jgi:hypothetical protein
MLTLLTIRFVPFFLLLWIVSNISVSIFPIQVLPHIYRYGYAFPFYNISRAVRTIVFSTKNDGGYFILFYFWVEFGCWWSLLLMLAEFPCVGVGVQSFFYLPSTFCACILLTDIRLFF